MIIRITLALLVGIPAAMAYPWQSPADRWLLGVAIAMFIIVFAWWRGLFVTTIIARRISMVYRRNHTDGTRQATDYATVVLRVDPLNATDLPLGLVTGYIDRYGISFDKVRVTSRDLDGARMTWVGLTLRAADNVSALRARSPRIPLQDTVQIAARRLADHLREMGWEVEVAASDADKANHAAPVPEHGKETWRGVTDGQGYVAAYRIAVDDKLADTLDAVWTCDSDETWTVLEITGSRIAPELAVACSIRTRDRPGPRAPLPGLTPERGRHRPALAVLGPVSDDRLPASPVRVPAELWSQLQWPSGAALSRT
ncbi:ESX-3 secretion system protein EccE3 [Mycolicibacterium cyprinidarum]|uniref:ESX-3 secretion system protein EccE3 n=1 Tax=Mycolicibacterium cyprinidarum TaxID=2860311 RepID=A0ABQ4V9J9_9MYCO|nr:ESX-3 secretion system protein EccE3 [Mycolicibacterium sp. NGTWSNA01]GJF15684.1 ESX-3 secretion system protein EccE3 [Mycolicibacterium sp. NGTWS1803]GJF19486.1 ESX-3 secretion system protein EccE3 [Mycolicibacterium sp. NGTWS0302]